MRNTWVLLLISRNNHNLPLCSAPAGIVRLTYRDQQQTPEQDVRSHCGHRKSAIYLPILADQAYVFRPQLWLSVLQPPTRPQRRNR